MPSTVVMSAIPGKRAIHHAVSMYWRPSPRILPQVGVGGWIPSPRKLIVDSSNIILATSTEAITKMSDTTLGKGLVHRGRCQEEQVVNGSLHYASTGRARRPRDPPPRDGAGDKTASASSGMTWTGRTLWRVSRLWRGRAHVASPPGPCSPITPTSSCARARCHWRAVCATSAQDEWAPAPFACCAAWPLDDQYASESFWNSGPDCLPSAAFFRRNMRPPHVVLQETKYGVTSRQFACTKSSSRPEPWS